MLRPSVNSPRLTFWFPGQLIGNQQVIRARHDVTGDVFDDLLFVGTGGKLRKLRGNWPGKNRCKALILFGAGDVTRTRDLLITNHSRHLRKTSINSGVLNGAPGAGHS
jgi:hypothetical protein